MDPLSLLMLAPLAPYERPGPVGRPEERSWCDGVQIVTGQPDPAQPSLTPQCLHELEASGRLPPFQKKRSLLLRNPQNAHGVASKSPKNKILPSRWLLRQTSQTSQTSHHRQ